MRNYRRLQWLVVVLGLVIGLVGCESGIGRPTAPAEIAVGEVSMEAASPANFWMGRGRNRFGVYLQGARFQIQAPEGAYLLTYNIEGGGEFYIVFAAGQHGALLTIGLLPGHVLSGVTIVEGEVPQGLEPEQEGDGVRIYFLPTTTAKPSWRSAFRFSLGVHFVVLVKDGEVVDDDDIKCNVTIRTKVNDPAKGSIVPPAAWAPCGASRMFKIKVTDPLGFVPGVTVEDVRVNGFSVLKQVGILGNGDGHLVIHQIWEENLLLEVDFL